MKKGYNKDKSSLTLLFSIIIFVTLLVSIFLAVGIIAILVRTEVISGIGNNNPSPTLIIVCMAVISLLIGSIASFFVFKVPLRPVNNIIRQMNRLATGDFKARLELNGMLSSYPALREVTDSFNKMAEELEQTELLRSDFINNFSHEFKTPIVSIAGFAKVLKRGNLTEEQKKEYIDIIEEEALRLSYMATNVLNLTKVENQTILTGETYYNLSEQIRSCVLLLEKKWTEKHLDLGLEFREYSISANEELLKQVWINLIDNAIKFTPDYGTVNIKMSEDNDIVTVKIMNTGSEIPPEKREKIWGKFYQGDESHSSEGNGIGLAIVKKVVDLHGGSVGVESENSVTTFTVKLPL